LTEFEADIKRFKEENAGLKTDLHNMTLSYHGEQLRNVELKKKVEGNKKKKRLRIQRRICAA